MASYLKYYNFDSTNSEITTYGNTILTQSDYRVNSSQLVLNGTGYGSLTGLGNIISNGYTAITFWIRCNNDLSGAIILDLNNIIRLGITSSNNLIGTLNVSSNSYTVKTIPNYNINDNVWRHVALTISGGITPSLNIYINGIKNSTNNTNVIYPTINPTNNYLGKSTVVGTDPFFIGAVDDFFIYNKYLSDLSINFLYTASASIYNIYNDGSTNNMMATTTPSPAPAIWYTFNSSTINGNDIQDNSNGTLQYDASLSATATKSLISSTDYKLGNGSLLLGGGNTDYVTLPSFQPTTNGLSFACWFRSTGNGDGAKLFDFGNSYTLNNISMGVYNNNLTCAIYNNNINSYIYNPYFYYTFEVSTVNNLSIQNMGIGSSGIKGTYDAALSNNNMILANDVKVGTTSLLLNGNNFMSLSSFLSESNGLTFAMWMRSNNNNDGAKLFDFGNGSTSDNIMMGIYRNNLAVDIYNGSINSAVNLIYKLNPLLYYNFDSNSVNGSYFADMSSGVPIYDATLVNGATILNRSLIFNSVVQPSGQYAILPSITTSTNGFTIGFWFKANSSPANSYILNFGNASENNEISFMINSNNKCNITFFNGISPTTIQTTDIINNNIWRHIVIVVNVMSSSSFNVLLYLNGQYNNNVTVTNQPLQSLPLTFNYIGSSMRYIGGTGYTSALIPPVPFIGSVAEFFISNTGYATQAQITALYSSNSNIYSNINDNVWRHYAWTIAKNSSSISTWKLYVNGNLTKTITNTNYPNNILRVTNYIGKSNTSTDPAFNGAIDDFRMYKSVLSDSDISGIYFNTAPIATNSTIMNNNTVSNINDNVWRHITWTLLPSGIWNIYINGTLYHTATGLYPQTTTLFTSNYLGKSNWIQEISGGAIGYSGSIDDFRIYNRALTSTEANTISTINPLYFYYPFELSNVQGTTLANMAMQTPQYDALLSTTGLIITSDYKVGSSSLLLNALTSSQHVILPSFWSGMNGLTFACWFKANGCGNANSGSGACIFEFSNGATTGINSTTGNDIIRVSILNGINLRFTIFKNSIYTTIPSYETFGINVNDNVWRHLTWTIATDGTWKIYINGVLTNTTIQTYPNNILRSFNYIGKSLVSTNPYFNGGIDDFRMYKSILNDSDVLSIYKGSTLYMHYTFDKETVNGNIVSDLIGGSAILSSTVLISTGTYKVGTGSLSLNNNTFVTLPTMSSIGINGITVALWINASTNSDNARIFDFGNGFYNNNIVLYIQNSNLIFGIYNGTSNNGKIFDQIIKPSICNSGWTHIAITVSINGGWQFYIDGKLTTTATGVYPIDVPRTINYFGKSNNSSDPYYNGYIDDFRIYKSILSTSDIYSIFNTTSLLSSPGRIGYQNNGIDFANMYKRNYSEPNGIIKTIAGNGKNGFSGDGALAINAQFNNPSDIAFDMSQNIYIADTNNNVIRKIDASSGIITTIAGTGFAAYSGATDSVVATSANINPKSIDIDTSNNIYIADYVNNRIRMLTASTGNITTICGNGVAGSSNGVSSSVSTINQPCAIRLDLTRNVYICEDNANATVSFGNNIRKITSTNKIVSGTNAISTIAGTSTAGSSVDLVSTSATGASFNRLTGIAIDANSNIYISDMSNNRVRKITSGGIISTIAGSNAATASTSGYSGDGGLSTASLIYRPIGLSVDTSNNLYIADYSNNAIRMVNTTTNIITTIARNISNGYSGDGGVAINAGVGNPCSIRHDFSNNIYIIDSSNCVIRKITKQNSLNTNLTANNTDIASQLSPKSGIIQALPISDGFYNSQVNNIFEPVIQKAIPISGQIFTSNTLTINNQTWNITSSSQQASYPAYNAFNNTTTSYWQDGNSNYNTTGSYTGAITTSYFDWSNTSRAITGEWIQIQLPYQLKMTEYSFIINNVNNTNRLVGVSGEPINWIVVGSNNNSTWYLESSGNNITPIYGGTLRTYQAISSQYYNYHRFIINALAGNSNVTNAAICQWNINGIYNYTNALTPITTNYSNIEQIIPPPGRQMTGNTLTYNNRSYTVTSSSVNSSSTIARYTNLPYTACLNLPYNNDISNSIYSIWSCSGNNLVPYDNTGVYSKGGITTSYYGGNKLDFTAKDLSLNSKISTNDIVGIKSIAVNNQYNRILYCKYAGQIYIGTIYGTTITSSSAFDTTVRNYSDIALTTDATRGVACDGTYCYYFTWNGYTYSTLTSVDSLSRTYQSIAISSDGSRIVASVSPGYIYYSLWNGTSYNTMTQTLETVNNYYYGIGISFDGTRLVYGTNGNTSGGGYVLYSVWNGTNYTAGVQTADTQLICARKLVFSNDMNNLYYSASTTSTSVSSLWVSTYNPTLQNYGIFYPISTSIIPLNIDANGLCVTENGQSLYLIAYSTTNATLYQLSTNMYNVSGEWLQVQLSSPAKITSYGLLPPPGATIGYPVNHSPQIFYLLGSNDGLMWYLLDAKSLSTAPSDSTVVSYYATTTSNSINYYTYYRLVVYSTFSGNSYGFFSIGQLQLFGTYL